MSKEFNPYYIPEVENKEPKPLHKLLGVGEYEEKKCAVTDPDGEGDCPRKPIAKHRLLSGEIVWLCKQCSLNYMADNREGPNKEWFPFV